MAMSMLRIVEEDPSEQGLRCPKCNKGFYAEWETECADSPVGEHVVRFPCCGVERTVLAWVSYHVYPTKADSKGA